MPSRGRGEASGPDTGAHELTGTKKGIRIGSAKDGEVVAFIEDSESTGPDHSGAEGSALTDKETSTAPLSAARCSNAT